MRGGHASDWSPQVVQQSLRSAVAGVSFTQAVPDCIVQALAPSKHIGNAFLQQALKSQGSLCCHSCLCTNHSLQPLLSCHCASRTPSAATAVNSKHQASPHSQPAPPQQQATSWQQRRTCLSCWRLPMSTCMLQLLSLQTLLVLLQQQRRLVLVAGAACG